MTLLLLFIFFFGLTYLNPAPNSGPVINFGFDEQGAGETASSEQVDEPVFLGSNGEAIRENNGDPETLNQPLKTDLTPSEIITKTYSTKQARAFNALPLS